MSDDHYKRYEEIHFPQTKIMLQSKEGSISFLGPPSIIPPPLEQSHVLKIRPDEDHFSQPNVALSLAPTYSADGKYLARVPADKNAPIEITSSESGEILSTIPCTDAQNVQFSPLGTFLVTWSRQLKPKSGEAPQSNLHVWRVASEQLQASFSQRQMQTDMIQWNNDESVCIRLVSNEVHIYNGSSPGTLNQKVYHKDAALCSISPNPAVPVIAVFTPEGGGKHAKVDLYAYNKNLLAEVVAKGCKAQGCDDTGFGRTLFAANECTFKWNLAGDRIIVQTQCDVDSASYYGSTGLFLLAVDGSVSLKVPQSKDGHVAAAEWSPTGDIFIMAAGNMPCHVTMFSKDGEAVYEFGAMHRNTISFAPHGRFLCLAGFGNLAGDMDFYDFSGNKRKKIGSANSHCAVKWAWSPDSRYFMTATLRPRMNVDNGIKIFKYNGAGGVVVAHSMEYLYDAQWRPALLTAYPDRSRSPARAEDSSAASQSAAQKPATVGVYRPPGYSGAVLDMMKRSTGPKGKIVSGVAPSSSGAVGQQKSADKFVPSAARRPIPGMPPAAIAAASSTDTAAKSARKRGKGGKGDAVKDVPLPPPAPAKAAEKVDEPVDTEKKIKNLRKKLKQVAELKEKQTGGEVMNDDQIKKIQAEADILKELALLEV